MKVSKDQTYLNKNTPRKVLISDRNVSQRESHENMSVTFHPRIKKTKLTDVIPITLIIASTMMYKYNLHQLLLHYHQ